MLNVHLSNMPYNKLLPILKNYNSYKIFINKNLNSFVLMNKTDLVSSIAEKAGLSKADSKKALDATIEAIVEALKTGDKVALVGFGTFSVAERPERQGINPATKAPITIAAKKVAKFKAGADLDNAIN